MRIRIRNTALQGRAKGTTFLPIALVSWHILN
jgi:hypothetical protein